MTEEKVVSVAEYMKICFDACEKSQKQIADEIGFSKPNMVSMIKTGATQLPIAKISLVANAVGVDPKHLFRMAMAEYQPENLEVIDQILGQTILSSTELEVITLLRKCGKTNPTITTYEQRDTIIKAFAELDEIGKVVRL